MVHDSREQALFPHLPDEVLAQLPSIGQVMEFQDGEELFREGQRDYPFYAVLDGRIRVTKLFGADRQTLTVHGRGQFAGEISMLTGRPAIASGHALGGARVVRIEVGKFRQLAANEHPLAKLVIGAMTRRTEEVEAHARQQDKLAALGKLSAGLAHELNNPASATKRAAQLLKEALAELRLQSIQHDCRFTEEEREILKGIEEELDAQNAERPVLDAVERSDLEDELAQWLSEHSAADAWELAPTLVDAGFTLDCMNTLAESFQGESLLLGIGWVEKSLRAAKLAAEIQSASARISELVAAMKDYSYMDRSDFQDTDVHRGLESTLTIFASRLKKSSIRVERNFAPDLPIICAHPGELNQVWTNLISNSLDAMNGEGTLTITTQAEGDGVTVEIRDTGPGIPESIKNRVFEPFFTTKAVGQGTGLGLDIVYRIVRARHGGEVWFTSVPGDTRFHVKLLTQPPKEVQ